LRELVVPFHRRSAGNEINWAFRPARESLGGRGARKGRSRDRL